MCYSAMLQQNAKKFGIHYKVRMDEDFGETLKIRVFPHTEYPVIIEKEGTREVHTMNYSLIPSWSKERKPKFSTYNARVETLCKKPTWREPVKTRRCLIGLTSFFESCYSGTHAGNIVEFFPSTEGQLLSAAGIWGEWIDKSTGEIVESFAMITTKPSSFIEKVGHDRSPLFLPESAYSEWLKEKPWTCDRAQEFLLDSYKSPNLDVKIDQELKSKKKV